MLFSALCFHFCSYMGLSGTLELGIISMLRTLRYLFFFSKCTNVAASVLNRQYSDEADKLKLITNNKNEVLLVGDIDDLKMTGLPRLVEVSLMN